MTAAKPSSHEAVTQALAARGELTSVELASTAGLGRSTVTKTLAALEQAGQVHRRPGGCEGGRRLPDHWSPAPRGQHGPKAPASSTERLRPGRLDGLVLNLIDSHGRDAPIGITAVAKALGRSAGAVGNCLTRLTAAGRVRRPGTTRVATTARRLGPVHPTPLPEMRSHEGDRPRLALRRPDPLRRLRDRRTRRHPARPARGRHARCSGHLRHRAARRTGSGR